MPKTLLSFACLFASLLCSSSAFAQAPKDPVGPQLEIVLNRFLPRSLGIDEENITKALTRPVNWKIPSDYLAARRAQNTATPLAMEDSPISQVIRQMVRTACGLPATQDKKKKFGLF